MSITVYIDGWNDQPKRVVKTYLVDTYENMTEEDFAGQWYPQDKDGRHYEMHTIYDNPFPKLNMSNGNWADLSSSLGLVTEDGIGTLSKEEIPAAIGNIMRFLNSQARLSQAVRGGSRQGNMIDFGTTENYLMAKASALLELLKAAQRKNKGVYWA